MDSEISQLTPMQASILGIVEGITEYLPISSTGHLVLASEFMGLRDPATTSAAKIEAVKSFEIVIQFGAIVAVLWIYRHLVGDMLKGVFGKSAAGRKLAFNLIAAFIPTAVLGLTFKGIIKTYLQSSFPVVAALLVGGVFMIVFSRTKRAKSATSGGKTIYDLSLREALLLGTIQSIALWPGTSRSMVTIAGGISMGLSAVAAAEFSFLLGLVTLTSASCYSFIKDGAGIIHEIGLPAVMIGLVTAGVSAGIAVKWFVGFLNRHGLAMFGWYRLAVGVVLLAVLSF